MKQGANRSDINRIRELAALGLTVSEISAKTLIIPIVVANFAPDAEDDAVEEVEPDDDMQDIGPDLD